MGQSVRVILKAETAGSHARAEAAFEAGYALTEPRGLERFLTCMLSAHLRFESACHHASRIAGLEDRSAELIEALGQSLVGTDVDARAAHVTAAPTAAEDFCLGAAYVFEGSAMGAAVLKKRIYAAGLELPPYLSLMTQSASSRWPRFVQTLDSRTEAAPLLAGAETVFEHLVQEAESWS